MMEGMIGGEYDRGEKMIWGKGGGGEEKKGGRDGEKGEVVERGKREVVEGGRGERKGGEGGRGEKGREREGGRGEKGREREGGRGEKGREREGGRERREREGGREGGRVFTTHSMYPTSLTVQQDERSRVQQ